MADFFRKQANRRNGKQVKGFSPELTRWLFAQDWKGNVRQLKNVVESMVVLDIDDVLDVDDISPDVQGEPVVIPPAPPTSAGPGWLVGSTLREIERWAIEETLKITTGNREETARILGISERNLYRKLNEYELK